MGAGVLAIVAAVLLVTGIQLDHAYDAAAAVCRQQGNCAAPVQRLPLARATSTAGNSWGPSASPSRA